MSDSTWEYNCPQFVDFSTPLVDDPNVEAYFNFDHENEELVEEECEVSAESEETSLYEDARTDKTPAPCKSGTPCRKDGQLAGRRKPKTPLSTSKRQAVRTPRSETKTSPYNMRSKKNVDSSQQVKSEDGSVDTASEDCKTPQHVPANLCTSLSAWRNKCSKLQSHSEPARKAHELTKEKTSPSPLSVDCDTHGLDQEMPLKEEVEVDGKKLHVPPNLCTSLSAWRSNSTKVVSQSKPVRKSPGMTKGGLRSAKQKERRLKSACSTPDVNAGSRHSPASKRQRRSLVPSDSEDDACATPQSQRRQTLSLERSTPGVKPPSIKHAVENIVVNNIFLDSQGSQTMDGSMDENDKITQKRTLSRHTRTNSATIGFKGRHTRSLSAQRDRRHLRSNSIKRTSLNEKTKEKNDSHMPSMKPKLTIPMTPTCLKRKGQTTTSSVKTSEEMEMERIKLLRQEFARTRKMAQESLQKAQTSSGYVPVRSKQPLTKTEDIHFATDDRIKPHHTETNNPEPKDFAAGLRKLSQPHVVHHGPTVPQPFKLTENRKRKREDHTSYHSTAELVRGFALKTPDRFHTRSKKELGPAPNQHSKQISRPTKLTVPKTPKFETRERKRHVNVISQQDIEDKEYEEIKSYKFKANPVNSKIMSNPNVGVRFVQPKECTQPIGFDLETENRRVLRSHNKLDKSSNSDENYEFHAQPIPKGLFAGPVGLKLSKEMPLTVPESPAFALKNRLRPKFKEEIKEEFKAPCARPVPHSGLPFQPKLEHRVTEPQPFSFEGRHQKMKEHKERLVQEALEEDKKAREFRAKPLRDLSPDLPSKSVKPPTKPQPFMLEVDIRGATKAVEWTHKMEEELQQQRQMASSFKARPSKVLYQEPFIPKQSTKPLTDINDIRLNTDTRAEKRAEWEQYVKQLEAEHAAKEAARERERLEEEKREVERLRKEAVHKPQPIKKYRPVEVKPSDKPLTEPHTPKFSERLKTRGLRT